MVNKKGTKHLTRLRTFTAKLETIKAPVMANLRKVQELDAQCSSKQECVEQLVGPLLQSWSTTKRDLRLKRYKAIRNALLKIEQLSVEKIKLATKNYEFVDSYVDELDKTYAKIAQSPRKSLRDLKGQKAEDVKGFDPTTVVDMPVDPNEPTFCICNQVSFGLMVMCDNRSCPIEWFHFGCVGLTAEPKGKWYCQSCLEQLNRKP